MVQPIKLVSDYGQVVALRGQVTWALFPRSGRAASNTEELNSDSTSKSFVLPPREAAIYEVETELSSSLSPLLTNEWFHISQSPKGGYGAFALQDIKEGTLILAELPLFRCENYDVFRAVENLSIEERKKYMELAHWDKVAITKIDCIFRTNTFKTGSNSGIFLEAARFNHACKPCNNCTYFWSEKDQRMKYFVNRDIVKGEEITIIYTINPSTLYANYGFFCECDGCGTLTEQEKRTAIKKAQEVYRIMMKVAWG